AGRDRLISTVTVCHVGHVPVCCGFGPALDDDGDLVQQPIPVTQMTEARMLQRPERAQLFKEYQASTSCWLPWLPRRRGAGMKME
ncbi:DUF1295-domain-containing protein, partial [Haematococcus lacustris]